MAAGPVLADPPLQMSFDGEEIVVSEIGAGSEIVTFLFSRSSRYYAPYNERRDETLVDRDGDGEIRIPLSAPPPRKFLAIAAELSSGRFGVLTPDGSPAREVALPAHSLLAGPGNRFDRLDYRSSYLELLVVRPQVGAWRLTTGDGTPTDGGPPSDGHTNVSPLSLRSLDESLGPLDAFERGDLLFGVSPENMEYFAARIVK